MRPIVRLAPGVLTATEFDGHARLVTFADGWQVRELIVDVDDDQQRLAYAVVDGVFTHHHASMEVAAEGEGAAASCGSPTCSRTTPRRWSKGSSIRGHRDADVFDGRETAPGGVGAARRLGRAMSDVITISLPDGAAREFPAGTTAGDVAASIGPRLAKAAVAATVAGRRRQHGDRSRPAAARRRPRSPSSPTTPRPGATCSATRRRT